MSGPAPALAADLALGLIAAGWLVAGRMGLNAFEDLHLIGLPVPGDRPRDHAGGQGPDEVPALLDVLALRADHAFRSKLIAKFTGEHAVSRQKTRFEHCRFR